MRKERITIKFPGFKNAARNLDHSLRRIRNRINALNQSNIANNPSGKGLTLIVDPLQGKERILFSLIAQDIQPDIWYKTKKDRIEPYRSRDLIYQQLIYIPEEWFGALGSLQRKLYLIHNLEWERLRRVKTRQRKKGYNDKGSRRNPTNPNEEFARDFAAYRDQVAKDNALLAQDYILNPETEKETTLRYRDSSREAFESQWKWKGGKSYDEEGTSETNLRVQESNSGAAESGSRSQDSSTSCGNQEDVLSWRESRKRQEAQEAIENLLRAASQIRNDRL